MTRDETRKSRQWKNSIFLYVGGFYLFQGFYATALGLYKDNFLVDNGITPGAFAVITALLILPNYLKMLPTIISDRLPIGGYRRRPYILIGAILYVPCFIGLIATHNPDAITPGWVFFVILTGWVWVLVDGTLDALTVDITPANRMGRLQGTAWGARGIGGVIGSIVIMIIGATYGWKLSLAIMGACAVAQAVFGLTIRENRVEKKDLPDLKILLKATFSRKDILYGMVFMAIAMSTTAPYMFFMPLFAEKGLVGLTKTQLGIGYALAMVGSFIGAMVAGWASDKIGAKKTFVIAAILFWCGILAFLPLGPGTGLGYSMAVIFIFGINIGAFMTPTNRISMELSTTAMDDKPGIEGFMFSTFSSISNFGTAVLGGMAIAFGSSVLKLKLTHAMFMALPLTLLSLFILWRIGTWEPQKEGDSSI